MKKFVTAIAITLSLVGNAQAGENYVEQDPQRYCLKQDLDPSYRWCEDSAIAYARDEEPLSQELAEVFRDECFVECYTLIFDGARCRERRDEVPGIGG